MDEEGQKGKVAWCVIFTQLHPGHFSIRVGNSSWCSEEIVKKKSQIVTFCVIITLEGQGQL